jgi:hypothetical protein
VGLKSPFGGNALSRSHPNLKDNMENKALDRFLVMMLILIISILYVYFSMDGMAEHENIGYDTVKVLENEYLCVEGNSYVIYKRIKPLKVM